jgi:hypothetical protein
MIAYMCNAVIENAESDPTDVQSYRPIFNLSATYHCLSFSRSVCSNLYYRPQHSLAVELSICFQNLAIQWLRTYLSGRTQTERHGSGKSATAAVRWDQYFYIYPNHTLHTDLDKVGRAPRCLLTTLRRRPSSSWSLLTHIHGRHCHLCRIVST